MNGAFAEFAFAALESGDRLVCPPVFSVELGPLAIAAAAFAGLVEET